MIEENKRVAKQILSNVPYAPWCYKNRLTLRDHLSTIAIPEEYTGPCRLGVWEVHIGNRAQRILFESGIFFLGDLIKFSQEQLIEFPKFGVLSLMEVIHMLKDYNLALRENDQIN